MKSLMIILALSCTCWSQNLPDAPSSTARKIEIAAFVGEVAYDGFTTQEILHSRLGGTEVDPIARPFVNDGAKGQVVASAIAIASVVGTSYLLHRLHHDKSATWVLHLAVVGEGLNIARQTYELRKSSHYTCNQSYCIAD
jgi:hypothetical protein